MKTCMKNLKKIDESNECYTPPGTVKYLLEFIPQHVRTIWCPCDTEESNIVKELREAGYDVIHTHIKDGFDFLGYEPIPPCYDMIITNPPFNIKTQCLERAYALGKPFIFYLPLTALEGCQRSRLYKKYGINVGVLNARLDFIRPSGNNKTKNSCWFATGFFYR